MLFVRTRLALPGDPGSAEFWAAIDKVSGQPTPPKRTDNFSALIKVWKESPEWAAIGAKTQYEWTRYLSRIEDAWGDLEVRGAEPKHALALRDAWAATPAAANNMLRCPSAMFSWSVPRGWRNDNPCREIKPLKIGDGYVPWPWEMIELARNHLREDLWWVAAVALYTGQRQGDCLTMPRTAIRDGLIQVRQEKTGKRLYIPIHRDLAPVLAQIPATRAVTILVNSKGLPWTKDGFRTSWGKAIGAPRNSKGEIVWDKPWPLRPIHDAGLVFHGLRSRPSSACWNAVARMPR